MSQFDPVHFKSMMLLGKERGWIRDPAPQFDVMGRKKREPMPKKTWRCRECQIEFEGAYRQARCPRCQLLGGLEEVTA